MNDSDAPPERPRLLGDSRGPNYILSPELLDEAHRLTRNAMDHPVAGGEAAQKALAPIGLLVLSALTDLVDLQTEDLDRRERFDRRLDRLGDAVESALERLTNPPPPPDFTAFERQAIAAALELALPDNFVSSKPWVVGDLREQLLASILEALHPKHLSVVASAPFMFGLEGRDRRAITRAVAKLLKVQADDPWVALWVNEIVHELETAANDPEGGADGDDASVSR